jgi:hypothetical protein
MELTATRTELLQPTLEYGTVAAPCEGGFIVTSDHGVIEASVAVSCLVTPQVGDIVLFSLDESGSSYILSILERPEGTRRTTELSFDGDLSIRVEGGRMSLASDEVLSLASRDFELAAEKGRVTIERASFFGRLVENNIERIKVVAEAMDTTIRRAVQRFTSSYRYVEEHEEVQSASTRMIIDGTLTMHTKNTMHIAEGHVKIDAEQIHLA